jgi:hypothetical protein
MARPRVEWGSSCINFVESGVVKEEQMHTVHYRPIKVVLGQVLNVHLELNAHT